MTANPPGFAGWTCTTPGLYDVVFDSDYPGYGGAGFARAAGYVAFEHVVHDFPYALRIRLPPLAAVFLRRNG